MKTFARLALLFATLLIATKAGAAPILKSGTYEVHGYIEGVSELSIQIQDSDRFIATFVWHDDVTGPNGLERHVAEIRGEITSPKEGFVRFESDSKPLRFPLDQEFEVVSDSQIRLEQGYLTKGPDGWIRRPEDTLFIVIKKIVEPTASENGDKSPPLS